MHIISGTHKGRNIIAPKNIPARPTTDFAKQGLFNILANRFDFSEISVLDLFSGIGGITFEFASRGCNKIKCVDADYACYRFVAETAVKLGFSQIDCIKSDALNFISKTPDTFDIIFADPPFAYDKHMEIVKIVFEKNLLNEGGTLVTEHPVDVDLSGHERFLETRRYGSVHFSFFK